MPNKPPAPHGPYDPVHHHHPGPPPYMVDRCADECDDQLPLFSQVGRGLQGDSYKVELIKDELTETVLEGSIYSERTGDWVTDWVSENINGGHLYYAYQFYDRPTPNDPKTFSISFSYVRPGRNSDENGIVWSFTTPHIPYAFDEDWDPYSGLGTKTLYIKGIDEEDWIEKLKYPDGMSRSTYGGENPDDPDDPDPIGPNRPWTVNLTYGIGKDSDDNDPDIKVPRLQDLQKVLGISDAEMERIILDPLIDPPSTEIHFPEGFTNFYAWIASLEDRVGGAEVNIENLADLMASLYAKLNSIGGIIWDKDRDNDGFPWVPSNDPANAKSVSSSFGKYSLFAIYHEGGATPAIGYIHRSRHNWSYYGPQGPGVDPKDVSLLDFDENQREALGSFVYDSYDTWTWNDPNDHSQGGHYTPLRALGGYAYTQTGTSYSDNIFNANLYLYSFERPVENQPNKLLFTHPARTFFHNKGDAGNTNRSPRYRDSDLKELNNSDTTIDSYDKITRIVGII